MSKDGRTRHHALLPNPDRYFWADFAMLSFARVTGREKDYEVDRPTLLTDLLADLMHWCDASTIRNMPIERIDFEDVLRRARRHFRIEQSVDGGGG